MVDETGLARRFATGEADAFEQVVECYAGRVAALVYRLMGYRGEVEDLVQDVFAAALQRQRGFRGDSSLWTWLGAIAIKRCRSHWRRRRIRDAAMRWLGGAGKERAGAPPNDHAAEPADAACLARESSELVRRAVGELPPRLREVVVLYYLEELPIDQIAPMIGAKRGAIEVRLHRARQILRSKLEARDQRGETG